jgi:DNA-binding response OmpR family regulator
MDAHILVVDDDFFSRKLLRVLLQSAGYRNVSAAANAEEALRIVDEYLPQLLLLDLALPGTGGLELARKLRASSRTATLPIVAMSASAPYRARQEAIDAGCDRYFPKPFDARALLDVVGALLEHSNGPGDSLGDEL